MNLVKLIPEIPGWYWLHHLSEPLQGSELFPESLWRCVQVVHSGDIMLVRDGKMIWANINLSSWKDVKFFGPNEPPTELYKLVKAAEAPIEKPATNCPVCGDHAPLVDEAKGLFQCQTCQKEFKIESIDPASITRQLGILNRNPAIEEILKTLIHLAGAAYRLADNTEDDGKVYTIGFREDFEALSKQLDILDKLPEPPGLVIYSGPGRAEIQLKQAGLIGQIEPELTQPDKPLTPPLISQCEDEELILQCIEVIKVERKASVSILQRNLRLGYTRAARIMDELERRKLVGPAKGAEPRDVFIEP